jgi:hypothetical protein
MCREDGIFNTSVICELELLHSERYRQLGILIHRQNSHSPHGQRCTGRRELVK